MGGLAAAATAVRQVYVHKPQQHAIGFAAQLSNSPAAAPLPKKKKPTSQTATAAAAAAAAARVYDPSIKPLLKELPNKEKQLNRKSA